MKTSLNSIQSVERTFDILETLAQQKEGCRITELVKKLRLKISTVHNQLKTLVQRGYVEQDNQTLKYKLGQKTFLLAQNYSTNDKLICSAKPYLEKLNEKCGDLVFLGVLNNHDLICSTTVESNQPLSVSPNQVWRDKCHSTASGKILLAYCSPEELRSVLKKHGLKKFTRKTITNFRALKIELKKVRRQGYAISQNESVEGITSLGVPIRDFSGKTIAALGISAPTVRMQRHRRQELLKMLKNTAFKISSALGQ